MAAVPVKYMYVCMYVCMYVSYILPIVHTLCLHGEQFKVQRSVEAKSACDVTARTKKRGQRGNTRGIIVHLNWLNMGSAV